MIDIKTKETFSEVNLVLDMLGEQYINKLPSRLYKTIQESSDKTYTKEITSIDKNHIKKESLAILAVLYLKYWCDSNKEKELLVKMFSENEKKHQAELQEKYDLEKVFKDRKVTPNTSDDGKKTDINVLPIEIKQENIFKRIIKRILSFFR